jgi:hypothetical protein
VTLAEPHPKLRCRLPPNPRLKRPTREHPVLGRLEYVNRNGAWWQSVSIIAGSHVRLDLQHPSAKLDDATMDAASQQLSWIQSHHSDVLRHAALQLERGHYRPPCDDSPRPIPLTPSQLSALRPFMVHLLKDFTIVRYECDALPDGTLCGADCLEVTTDRISELGDVLLLNRSLDDRANVILSRPLPPGLPEYKNSIPDQFVAKLAADYWIRLDKELTVLLNAAIEEVRTLAANPQLACSQYMGSVEMLLRDVARSAENQE